MSYQVIARKYRPQTFDEVIGQQHVTVTLKNAIASDRIYHAYLFAGARGIGKTTVARILAKALNCKNPNGEEPCGECASCRDIANGSSLDVQEIDGASNTGVDDVRDIRERIKYMPSSSKYKIYIIDEVHMLSTSAFNALLKTLEEPPEHVIFIFATTEVHKILPTILSRCQRYDFRRISFELLTKTLNDIAKREGIKVDKESISIIAREATGSLRDAESLFDQAIAFSGNNVNAKSVHEMLGIMDRNRLFAILSAVFDNDAVLSLNFLEDAFKSGADLVRLSNDILGMLKSLLIIAECGDIHDDGEFTQDERTRLKKLASSSNAASMHRMFTAWYDIASSASQSSFPKMLLEVGLIKMCRISHMKPIDDIIARLNSLLKIGTPIDFRKSADQITTSTSHTTKTIGNQKPSPHTDSNPSFTPAADKNIEAKWQSFMRVLAQKKPQISSMLTEGSLSDIGDDYALISFDKKWYCDELSGTERKSEVEKIMSDFFGRPFSLRVKCVSSSNNIADNIQKKQKTVRDVLSSDIVKKAADLLNAKSVEVKIDNK